MALNWNIENCKLDKEWQTKNWPAIENLIMSTMVVDIGEITEKNLKTFDLRLRMYRQITGYEVKDMLAILPKLVGLRTNVITLTDKQYQKKLVLILQDVIEREVRVEKVNNEDSSKAIERTE